MSYPISTGDNFEIINFDWFKMMRFDANVFKMTLEAILGSIGSYVMN